MKRFFYVVIFVILQNKFKDAFQNKRALTLTGMLTRHKDNSFRLLIHRVAKKFSLEIVHLSSMQVMKREHLFFRINMISINRQTT